MTSYSNVSGINGSTLLICLGGLFSSLLPKYVANIAGTTLSTLIHYKALLISEQITVNFAVEGIQHQTLFGIVSMYKPTSTTEDQFVKMPFIKNLSIFLMWKSRSKNNRCSQQTGSTAFIRSLLNGSPHEFIGFQASSREVGRR